MEQKVADNESVARILSNAWFEDGELLHIAFRQRIGESYISVNRPVVSSYANDVERFVTAHNDFQYNDTFYRRAIMAVSNIRSIKVAVGNTEMTADVEVEPRDNKTLSHAGIFTRFRNENVKPGKMIKVENASEEISADTLLLEVRSQLLSISTVETCKLAYE